MYYKRFSVGGVANVTTLDAGLVSLVEEKVHIDAIFIMTNVWADNVIEGWIGNERVLELTDFIIITNDDLVTNPRTTTQLIEIPINLDIPAGQIFKIGIRCGAAASNILGSYNYTKLP
ncbi:hypothetical protein LCGC14_1377390 [marine sediment metagenome]|uniref:Uncharacterized protein n=1 Tax=marine sediment metagenome TaxID=412755 RepID=A0A0F9MIY7_9ZZZZ